MADCQVLTMALGGSTNAVLHLIAMAHAVGINLTIDDFQSVSDRVPFLADLKPSGKYVMEDVNRIGGTPSTSCLARFLLTHRCHQLPHQARSYDGRWHDRHRQDAWRKLRGMDGEARQEMGRTRRHSPARQADQGDRTHQVGATIVYAANVQDFARKSRTRRSCLEDHGQRGTSLPGQMPRV